LQGSRFSRVVEPLLEPIDSILASIPDVPLVDAADERGWEAMRPDTAGSGLDPNLLKEALDLQRQHSSMLNKSPT
jgi:hypothetical protein